MNIIGDSIQENLKKINSSLSLTDCISIMITTLIILAFAGFLYMEKINSSMPVTYKTIGTKSNITNQTKTDSRPFASKNGKTYTFSWCQGASVISAKNKIYFIDETSAQNSGRTLSKLCQK